MNIRQLLVDFMDAVCYGNINVYNEISLQLELGIFLRTKISDCKVEFERNTKHFNIADTIKHEIDLTIYRENELYSAIELKYPRNGQCPEQMFSFVKDLRFIEELKSSGFQATYCITLVDDKRFYSGREQGGIYTYFRKDSPIHGTICKPTGKRDETIDICGKYVVDWKGCGTMRYYILEAQ